MFRLKLILFLVVLLVGTISAQDTIVNEAFRAGEHLKYRVYYSSSLGNLTAGEAIITVEDWKESAQGRTKDVYHITGLGNSKGMFNWFFKVRDKFESFVDKETLLPYLFIRKTREGKFKQDDTVVFNRHVNEAVSSKKVVTKVPSNIHDFVSAVFYMRTLQVEDFDADSMFRINFFLDDSVYMSAVKFQGRSIVETKWGPVKCLRIAPMMASGEVFAEQYPMHVYVTDDEMHLPVLAESKVIVGSIKMDLVEYYGTNSKIQIFTQKEKTKPGISDMEKDKETSLDQ